MAEQNNFAISEFINNKKAESNYEPIKNKVIVIECYFDFNSQLGMAFTNQIFVIVELQVLKLQWEYNKMLIEALKKN